MENTKFNFASVIAIMVLLVFSYITYLGLVYWRGGEFLFPILLTLAFFILVMVCVYVMCLSKATRWKRMGKIGQIFFGFIVLLTFIGTAFPFTNFLRVIEDSERISAYERAEHK